MHKDRLTPVVKRAYRDVHQGWADRTPILSSRARSRSRARGR